MGQKNQTITIAQTKRIKSYAVLVFLSLAFPIIGQGSKKMKELITVEYVDINRYLGKWYEISKYPNRFEKNCFGVTAEYSLRLHENIKVVNSCKKGSLEGKEKSITGKAWVQDKTTNAKLRVQFFWPFSSAYWIIDLGKNYEYAVVGHPKRKFLWILSRVPEIDKKTYSEILKRISEQGYDINKIEMTPQKP